MRIENLRQFLVEAAQHGYGSGDESGWQKEPDQSTIITYESEEFRLHDNFFGGEPFGGREVVFDSLGNPQWMMVYWGAVEPSWTDIKGVYHFLQSALQQPPSEAPYRGPAAFDQPPYHYRNFWQGELEEFHGHEVILYEEQKVYHASYLGGLVDQRSEG